MTETIEQEGKRTPAKRKNTKRNNSTSKTQETTPTEVVKADISSYVSNLDGNVYAIANLPEEFIATLFAWVSRSSKSFRTHLEEAATEFQLPTAIQGFNGLNKKAKEFHEKWTVGYGHSSVAEHATAHVGIEQVSRLASSEIELANSFLSITEYSQRYQKPTMGAWHNPFESGSDAHKKVEDHFTYLFEVFEKLIKSVHAHLDEQHTINTGKTPTVRESFANQKLAFEDARYILPLAMHTQLGMSANGRAWRDALAVLGTSKYAESQELATKTKEEISKVLPTLLKYADPSPYQLGVAKEIRETYTRISNNNSKPTAKLLSTAPEQVLINEVLAYYIVEAEGRPLSDAINQVTMYNSDEENNAIFDKMVKEMKFFDNPPTAFKHVRYRADFVVSEANWHQLLRHNRMTDFTYGSPSINAGVVIPERIRSAGMVSLFVEAVNKTTDLYKELLAEGRTESLDYLVLNAHKRVVTASFSLWEVYHLINLRTSEEAQWDIREAFDSLYKQLLEVHPRLVSMAKRRQ